MKKRKPKPGRRRSPRRGSLPLPRPNRAPEREWIRSPRPSPPPARKVAELAVALFLVMSLAVAAQVQSQVITTLTDPVGDDYGPGSYTYPTNSVFTAGSFDMTEFQVRVEGNRVYFTGYETGRLRQVYFLRLETREAVATAKVVRVE